MNALLSWLQKRLVWSIPGAMLVGLLLGGVVDAHALRAALLPLTLLMVFPMMVTLKWQALTAKGGWRLQLTALGLNFVLMPLLGWAAGWLFFADQAPYRLALLLTALLPTSGMTISWTGLAKGNVPAAVRMTVLGLILGALLAPLYLQVLMGAAVDVPLMDMAVQIGLTVFVPMGLGLLTQKVLVQRFGPQRFEAELKPLFPAWSTLGVLGVVFVSMAVKAPAILAAPQQLLSLLPPLLLLYALNFALSSAVAKRWFSRANGLALVYGTVMRNLSIALALALAVFQDTGADAALLIALAYIVQVQSGAWYARWADRLFGGPPASIAPAKG